MKNGMARLTGSFGAIHGDVGVAQQSLGLHSPRRAQRQTDARADDDLAIDQADRNPQGFTDALGHQVGLAFCLNLLQ